MRRTAVVFLAVIAAVGLLLSHPPQAVAKTIIGASCNPPPGVQPYYILYDKQYAESFSPRHTGRLTKGSIETFNALNQPATYTVEIWHADLFGLPTGTGALVSTTVNHPSYGYDVEFPSFTSPLKVIEGKKYAIVVTVPDKNNNGITVIPGNVCAGTFSLNQNGTAGAFTVDSQNRDMDFAIFVSFKHHHHRR